MKTETCWLWTGAKWPSGYGQFQTGTSRTASHVVHAHRWSYEQAVGPIPEGLYLDHTCHSEAVKRGECAGNECIHRSCVNPEHLEPVTDSENVRRGVAPAARWAERSHCDSGHEYTAENTYRTKQGARVCKACRRDRKRADRATPEGRAAYDAYMRDLYQRKLKAARSN
jgi:hypothetical protein